MPKDATVRARIDSSLKKQVEKLFDKLGMSTTEAITLFYTQVKLRRGLPFRVEIPNEMTEKVFQDTDNDINVIHCENAEEMFDQLGI